MLQLINLQVAIFAEICVALSVLLGIQNSVDPAYLANARTIASCALPLDA